MVLGGEFPDAFHSRFEAGHGEVREERDEMAMSDPLLDQIGECGMDGGVLVAHAEFDRDIDALLEEGLHLATGEHEG
ncbi:MAG: hypothetical protein RI897_1892 [Verrucomicrobiota bacterium]